MSSLPAPLATEMAKQVGLLSECYSCHITTEKGNYLSDTDFITIVEGVIDGMTLQSIGDIPAEHIDAWQKMMEEFERLTTFQKLALTLDFEKCLIIYPNINDDQKDILKIIHEITIPWSRGHLIDALVSRIHHGKADDKSIAAIAKVVVEAMDENPEILGEPKNGKGANGVIKQFYMELKGES